LPTAGDIFLFIKPPDERLFTPKYNVGTSFLGFPIEHKEKRGNSKAATFVA